MLYEPSKLYTYLDLQLDLPRLVDGLLRRAVQFQKPLTDEETKTGANCLYVGPCAIGVCMEPSLRRRFDRVDGDTGITTLLREEYVEIPKHQQVQWIALQHLHDAIVTNRYTTLKHRANIGEWGEDAVAQDIRRTRGNIRSFFRLVRSLIMEYRDVAEWDNKASLGAAY